MMMIMNLTICVLQPNNKMGRDCSMHGRHGLCIQMFSQIATTGRVPAGWNKCLRTSHPLCCKFNTESKVQGRIMAKDETCKMFSVCCLIDVS